MGVEKFINKSMLSKAIDLKKIGINEFAWNIDDILDVLLELKQKNKIILGGDVYKKNNLKSSTFLNWYYNSDATKSLEQNVSDGYDSAKKYIQKFIELNSDYHDFYFTVVV